MDTKLLIISIVLIILGLILIGVAFALANQIILPSGSANWTTMEIAILVGGILFLVVGIGFLVYSFYASKEAYAVPGRDYIPGVVEYKFE